MHLEPVTQRENLLRGEGPTAILSKRTHCPKGHEYTPENTMRQPNGCRNCRACNAIRCLAYYERNKKRLKAKMRARYWSMKGAGGE